MNRFMAFLAATLATFARRVRTCRPVSRSRVSAPGVSLKFED